MSTEISVAEQWMYTVLSGDATLMGLVTDIYFHRAPVEAELPFILVTYHMGNDVKGLGFNVIAAAVEYAVRAITDQNSLAPIEPAAARIQVLLHGASGTVTGGTVLSCYRERPFLLVEETDNRTEGAVAIRHLGAIYQVMAQGA